MLFLLPSKHNALPFHPLKRKLTSQSTASTSTPRPILPACFLSPPLMPFPFQNSSAAHFQLSTNQPPFRPVLGPPHSQERTLSVSPRLAAARHWRSAFLRSPGSSPPAVQRRAPARSSLRRRASSRFRRTMLSWR